ncbi:PD-(D/E)XK nuclease family protein [Neobacillus niacini]|uniref:PD-(D/E)XK nuclease family protein n=1 Tax=Neobacillus niacini TaxID=86668 RepID=UPI0021CB95C4|nr:PD-(D/E)XK nuclease family protein [Neobacillus niacini]MCM3768517.1 PD-(D/E)XK nuclease family protein [Neobacillus niacini]
MFSFVKELKQICTAFPIKEKMVIIDSHTVGEQINEAFVKAGNQAVNLKYHTVFDLAYNLVELNSNQPLYILDNTVGVHLTFTLLNSLKQQGRLHYFSGMEITPSFSHAIYNTIQTLRLSGYETGCLNKDAFITPEKAEDLAEILAGYEEMMGEYQFIDKASLLWKAIDFALTDETKVYILQSNLNLSALEEQFLEKILPEKRHKLPLAPVLGVNIPERTSLCSIRFGEPTPLSYLYQQEKASGEADLTIFTAKTEELEVKQILGKIKNETTPLDENVVYYTIADSYVTLFYQLSQKMNIPLTFGEGLPVSFSRPGRLVSGVLAWIQDNYNVQGLIDLLNEGLLELDDEAPSKSRIAKVLRDLQIGWSQERYLKHLNNAMEALNTENPYYETKLSELSWLKQWFSGLFKKLPPYSLTMNYKHCLTGIAFILKNYGKTSSSLDEIAKMAILEEIEKILPFADKTLSSYEAVEKLTDLLLSIRVNQSRPKPGHLHVSFYKSGIYNSRQHVYIVGLDNKKFPGNVSEDPLLLDAERVKLNSSLPLLSDKGQENLYLLLQVLAQSTGKVTVSYCDFDMNDNRVVNPAFVVLQCYRMMTENSDADFKSLKSLPTKIIADDIFDDKDYWNGKLTSDVPIEISEGVLTYFENVKNGLSAVMARHRNDFSEYEGLVQIDAAEYDPRLNQSRTLSAGKLETLAKCPYSYFLKEVLRIKPIEDMEFDANKWLDPATRGSLLHSIFETFYKQLKAENAKPVVAIHLDKLLAMAADLTQQQKEVLPPPNERVYLRELNDILECCRIFLKEEERHSENYHALQFEYAFGIGEKEPAMITLPSGEFKLSGIIDRVDQSSDGKYHIIDYKTGSSYAYSKNGAFKGGRQLQHLVYALAIEQHLRLGEGAVEESSYYFPTVKGMAERFVRKQDAVLRTNGLMILEQLIDIIKHGHFEMTDDENDCKFCELKLVCRRHFYDNETLKMKQSNQRLKGVRAYD